MATSRSAAFKAGRQKPFNNGTPISSSGSSPVVANQATPETKCEKCCREIGYIQALNGSSLCYLCEARNAGRIIGQRATDEAEAQVAAGLLGKRIEFKSYLPAGVFNDTKAPKRIAEVLDLNSGD